MRRVTGVGVIVMSFLFIMNAQAQTVDMALTVQSAPSITTSGGEVITPTQSETHQFEAATEETFVFVRPDDSSVEVVFFIGTTQLTLDLFIDAYENIPPIADDRPLPTGKNIAGGVIYEIRAFEGTTEVTTFDAPFAVNFHYLQEHIAGFIEETLGIYFWDESQSIWIAPTVTSRDTLQNIISVLIDHLTLFVLLGEEKKAIPSGPSAGGGTTGGGGGGGVSLAFLEDEATPLVEEIILPKEEVLKEPVVEVPIEDSEPALFDIIIEPILRDLQPRNIMPVILIFVAVFIGTASFISFSVWKRRRK